MMICLPVILILCAFLMPWFAEKSVMDDEFDNVVFCFYLYICLAFLLFPYL